MKLMIMLLGTLMAAGSVNAGEFYSVTKLWNGESPSYAVGDVVYCSGLDQDRNIALGCVNLNVMEGYSVKSDLKGNVVLTDLSDGDSAVVGRVQSGQALLDEVAAGQMNKVSMNNSAAKLEANILVRKSFAVNDQIGCQEITSCDWRVVYPTKKVSLEVKLNSKRLEKVSLN